MAHKPTEEQNSIIKTIQDFKNCVVIARPGSGKTYTLSHVIRQILPELPHYKGVIAISFTNKASDELETRSLESGVDRKSSFFGTIDKFYLTEIIIPFGRHIFGELNNEIDVITLNEVKLGNEIKPFVDLADDGNIDNRLVEIMSGLYTEGKIILETIGCLAVYILENSFACGRYLRARYCSIFIDEYQDCGLWQHKLFSQLVHQGLQGVAVGDINQSIFAFAKRDSRFLIELSQETDNFETFPLTENHRSHISIINYSTRLISRTYQPTPTDEIRVYSKHVTGSEIEIAFWLNNSVPYIAEYFQIERNEIGILVRSRRTGNFIHRNINFLHKPIVTTHLDNDSSLWGSIFRKILNWAFSEDSTKYELAEEYLNLDLQPKSVRKVMAILTDIEKVAKATPMDLHPHTNLFIDIAEIIFPNSRNHTAIRNLGSVLSEKLQLESFIPPNIDEVQLMTLHKAKGLEFEVVFHLDLYRWIMPMYNGDYIQDLNLHYVGITRAKQCVVLCSSTERHNRQGRRGAEDSEFLQMNDLDQLRVQCTD